MNVPVESIRITHFSDVLCIWAYISQVRIEELRRNFGPQMHFDFRFVQVFGRARQKLEQGWRERGGMGGYAAHVAGIGAQFPHAPLHSDIWRECVPRSSLPAHVFLCAVRLLEQEGALPADTPHCSFEQAVWRTRQAFFEQARDISCREVLFAIGSEMGLPVDVLRETWDSGAAHAALTEDLDLAQEQGIRACPTMLFNEGRQRLTGNVGYRVIEANVRELLQRPADQHSWC